MNKEQIMSYIDHTQLLPIATWNDIITLCDDALKNKTAAICIPPSYVSRARKNYEDLKIATVVGFPLGYQTKESKLAESKQAISEGADEIDMVINLGDVKNKDFEKITSEISEIKNAIGEKVLKVIIETCYLTQEEKILLCNCVTEGGADYIKTSTGFGTSGANVEDIKLFNKHLGSKVKIKASGGIKNKEEMEAFIDLGCERLGTSSAVRILNSIEK